jgi:ubiquinone/menaquinone biosynthesis C-methylase UbiE
MYSQNSRKQLQIIKEAYNQTVENYDKGISDLDFLPNDFKNSAEFKRFYQVTNSCNSGEPRIKEYLQPKVGMNYLDVGSCANIMRYKLYEWPSSYHGIDISQRIIDITNSFVKNNRILVGGLIVAEVSNLPYIKDYFDIASVIGVLEYYEIDYIIPALKELHRIVKEDGRLIIDMPNERHTDVNIMIEYETYLGRPRRTIPSEKEFVIELKRFFVIEEVDDSQLMIKYFLRNL